MFRSAEYQRGYDDGYKQALLDALKDRPRPSSDLGFVGRDPNWRLNEAQQKLERPAKFRERFR